MSFRLVRELEHKMREIQAYFTVLRTRNFFGSLTSESIPCNRNCVKRDALLIFPISSSTYKRGGMMWSKAVELRGAVFGVTSFLDSNHQPCINLLNTWLAAPNLTWIDNTFYCHQIQNVVSLHSFSLSTWNITFSTSCICTYFLRSNSGTE